MRLLGKRSERPSPEQLATRLEVLGRLAIFERAPSDAIEALAEATDEVDVAAGTDIVRQGRLPTHFYVVREGDLEVLSMDEDRRSQKRVNTLGKGDHFGEIGLLEGMPSTATVRTVSRCTLFRIRGADFLTVVDRSPSLSTILSETISGSLARTHPSYRPATEADTPSSPLAREADALAASLSEEEAARLQAWLRSLRLLSPAKRKRRVAELEPEDS